MIITPTDERIIEFLKEGLLDLRIDEVQNTQTLKKHPAVVFSYNVYDMMEFFEDSDLWDNLVHGKNIILSIQQREDRIITWIKRLFPSAEIVETLVDIFYSYSDKNALGQFTILNIFNNNAKAWEFRTNVMEKFELSEDDLSDSFDSFDDEQKDCETCIHKDICEEYNEKKTGSSSSSISVPPLYISPN